VRTHPEGSLINNWSGSISFRPRQVFEAECAEDVSAIVQRAAEEGRCVRVLGSSHSSTGILETDDYVVTLKRMNGLVSHNTHDGEATLWGGTTLEDSAEKLLEVDLSMHNLGDVATQMAAGAIGTGTHGTGLTLKNLSSMLIGGRMITATGDLKDFSEKSDPDFLKAVRVSFGSFGIFTRIRLRLQPAFKVQRREYSITTDECLERLDELVNDNRSFDFYWYPRRDEVKVRLVNAPGGGSQFKGKCQLEDRSGWAYDLLPKHSGLIHKFEEMEYELPYEAGKECFQEVRQRMLQRWRKSVCWRLLWRTVAADDTLMSPAYGRNTATISLHQNSSLPYWEFFEDIEPIFWSYGGRPHWAKKHTLTAKRLRPLYPKWDQFAAVRRQMDPSGLFMSDYLRKTIGDAEAAA